MGTIVTSTNFYVVSSGGSFALDATGGNMIVFVSSSGKSTNSPAYVNVCTYNAVSLTNIVNHRPNRSGVDIWVMTDPPTGSNTLAYSGSALTQAGTAFVMAGMATTNYTLATDTVVPASSSLATNAGGYCFAGFSGFASPLSGPFAGTGGTVETQEIHNGAHGSNGWVGYLQSITNPDTIGMSGASGSYQAWAAASIGSAGTGNQVIMIASRIQELYRDMKLGLAPRDEIARRYRELTNLRRPLEGVA